jgi:hypothetical protein
MKMTFSPLRKTQKSEAALAAVLAATVAFACGPAQAQTFPPEDPPCPTSVLTKPQGGLAPVPTHCTTPNCLVTFKGYQWWTSYQFPFYNGGLKSIFAPEHASIPPNSDVNLHLVANNDIDLGQGKVWSGAEAVLMFNADGSEANLGYGDYLVSARLVNGNWSDLDPNMAFGLFLYENPGTGPSLNPNREVDLAEISRWGWDHQTPPTCPIGGLNGYFPNNKLCSGDAQFALQLIPLADQNQGPLMVDRYNILPNNEVTLVMTWRDKGVNFWKYPGTWSFDKMPPIPPMIQCGADPNPGTPPSFWTSPPDTLTDFIPQHTSTSCERFHVNFWFGNYTAEQNPNPPPTSR